MRFGHDYDQTCMQMDEVRKGLSLPGLQCTELGGLLCDWITMTQRACTCRRYWRPSQTR